MSQYIEISSTDMRIVVQRLLELGKLGAEIDDTCPAFRVGPLYTTRVKIEDDSQVVYDPVVRKGKKLIKDSNKLPEVTTVKVDENKKFTQSELEQMSLAEIRKATGIKEGGKEAIIKQYLSQE